MIPVIPFQDSNRFPEIFESSDILKGILLYMYHILRQSGNRCLSVAEQQIVIVSFLIN